MDPLAALVLIAPSPLLLILLADRQTQDWFIKALGNWGWFRVLKATEPIGIMIAVVALVLTYLAFKEDAPVRRATLKALEEEAQDRKAGAEGRAWSLIYQAKGSTGDGGRRYALEYLNDRQANLAGLPLANAYLVDVKLPGAKLRKANLSGANLGSADLNITNLDEADLSSAELSSANLRLADLIKANLGMADLRGADLRGADLRGADLSGANLSRADLREIDPNRDELSEAELFKIGLRSIVTVKNKLKDILVRREPMFGTLKDILLRREAIFEVRRLTQKQIDSAFYCDERWSRPKLPTGLKLPPARKCDEDGKLIEE